MLKKIICSKVNKNIYDDKKLWSQIPFAINKLYKIDGSNVSSYKTQIKICRNDKNLFIRFYCDDKNILSEYTKDNQPIYKQEVVEVFIAPNIKNQYFEIDISPKGIIFSSYITNSIDGIAFKGDPQWNCAGLRANVERMNEEKTKYYGPWQAELSIPFKALNAKIPEKNENWYINFFRIKRIPEEEYSCWLPTYSNSPPNFHIPKYFGELLFYK